MFKFSFLRFCTVVFLIFSGVISAQTHPVTLDSSEALRLEDSFPDAIQILSSSDGVAAARVTEEILQILAENRYHGPGYVLRKSEEHALAALTPVPPKNRAVSFDITETDFVLECLDLVNPDFIEETILDLEAYGTRYHNKPQAEQAVLDQKQKWDSWIEDYNRDDINTRLFFHQSTPMPSVIITIEGAENPEEYVIVGGHMDSTSFWDKDDAPGADDNASGIASLNEMLRVLLEKNFIPKRTVEIMAFAAEELGLWGSQEIAGYYADNQIDVLAFVQFDMTGYQGSDDDVYIMTDPYTSSSLNSFLADLMDHYNQTGNHSFTYDYSQCGYGCSDHASWAEKGFDAAMPFESKMSESNPMIHSPNDVYSFFDTPDHAAKFTKLGLEFIIEAAKPATLGTDRNPEENFRFYVREKNLHFELGNENRIEKITIFGADGKEILAHSLDPDQKQLNLDRVAQGFYIARFYLGSGQHLSRKFILK